MNTNIDLITFLLDPVNLSFLILTGFGIYLKRTPKFPDWGIPWVLCCVGATLGAILYGQKYGESNGVLIGIAFALISVAGHQIVMRQNPWADAYTDPINNDKNKTNITSILIPILCSFLLSGCASTSINPDSVNDYVVTHEKLLTNGAAGLSAVALSLAEKDPVKRIALKADINQIVEKVARGLDAASSTADGTLSPGDLAESMKASDETVQAFLDAITVIYKTGYDQMAADGRLKETLPWAKLILNSLKVLADGLNKATA
jgi:hypothetical protein